MWSKKKNILFLFIAVLLLAAGITAVLKKQPPSSITLVQPYSAPGMLPHHMALQNDYFSEFNASVNIINCPAEETPRQLLAEGRAEIAVMEIADFLYSRQRNGGITAFAAAAARVPSFIMTREETGNFSWEDMKGKSIIGAPPSSTAGIMLEAMLKKNELAPYRSVNVYYDIPGDLREGIFKTGSCTYLQAGEPVVSSLENSGTARVAASLTGENVPYLVYVANTSYIKNNPEAIQKFTSSIYKAQQWIKYNRELIAENLGPHLENTHADLVGSISRRYTEEDIWARTPLVKKEEVEKFRDLMQEAGELPGPVDLSGCINNEFAQSAVNTVKYKPPKKKKEQRGQ